MGKYYTEDEEVVEREIFGDIWKFRVLEAGKLARLTQRFYDKYTGEIDSAGYVETLIKNCLVEPPQEFVEEFEMVKGKKWEGSIEDIQKLPPALYSKLGEVVTEIHGLTEDEKNF